MLRLMKKLPKDAIYNSIESPVGKLTLIASSQGLHAVLWNKDCESTCCKQYLAKLKKSVTHPVIQQTKKQLTEYFARKRKNFDIPLVLEGTPFQTKAWKQLIKIPYGKTISYGEQARRLGDKNKARAVGIANSKNPISIIVPCHRVIGKSGKLTGYGGGLDKKKYLLDLESWGSSLHISHDEKQINQ